MSLICTSERNKGGLGLEVPVFTCTFTVLMVSMSIKAILDRARLAAATPGQLRREGILSDRKEPNHNSKFISEFYIFLSQRNLFELLYSVNSQANLPWPCMGGCVTQHPPTSKNCTQLCTQVPLTAALGEDNVTRPVQFILKGCPAFDSPPLFKVGLGESSVLQSKASEASTTGRLTDAPETPNHHHHQKSEPTSCALITAMLI